MSALRLLWFVPPPIAVLATAIAPGTFDGARNRSSDEQFDSLVQGSCDAVVTAMDNVFAWNRRAGPGDFQIVAQVERTTPLSLIGSTITQLAEMRGAQVLVDAPGNGFVIALRALLADAGLAADTYELKEMGGVKERFDGLMAKAGDATLLGPPFDQMAIGAGKTLIARIQDAYPTFPGQGLVVRRSMLAHLQPQLQALLQAFELARARSRSDRIAARSLLVQAGVDPLAADPMLANLPQCLRPDSEGVALLIDHRRRLGLEGGDDSYEVLVNATLLPHQKKDSE